MDDLYLGWSGLEGAFGRLEELVLAPLAAGQTACFNAFNWTDNTKAGAGIVIEAGEWLVVEGCGCAPMAAQRWIDALVWWDGPWQRRRAAVVARDGVASALEIDRWEQATRQFFRRERTRERANLRLER